MPPFPHSSSLSDENQRLRSTKPFSVVPPAQLYKPQKFKLHKYVCWWQIVTLATCSKVWCIVSWCNLQQNALGRHPQWHCTSSKVHINQISQMMRSFLPSKEWIISFPSTWADLALSGWTAIEISPSIVSGLVVATTISSFSPSIAYAKWGNSIFVERGTHIRVCAVSSLYSTYQNNVRHHIECTKQHMPKILKYEPLPQCLKWQSWECNLS